jgi:malate dehydrogenase (quinone)
MHKIDITPQIVLIGTGIMSATLGVLLKELNPDAHIIIFEKLDHIAGESSDAWNNAGTGHSAYCELNYTPQNQDGTIDISKALKIASQFEVSKSFWAYLIKQGKINNTDSFLHQVPHYSFVEGDDDVAFLIKRFEGLSKHFLFDAMHFTQDKNTISEWLPLMMSKRNDDEKVAATKMNVGTDIDFGKLTRQLFSYLQSLPNVDLYMQYEVRDIDKDDAGKWYIKARDLVNHETMAVTTPFVFIGAGGGSLPLLEKANISEGEGFGGFPVSGQWLVCNNDSIIKQHHAKVYGKAKVGAPPMSVPHLDTRYINGKQALLFGPFAGFSTKFLKNGSYFDLPSSIEFSNLFPMLSAGWHNIPLTKYLIHQVMQSPQDRLAALQEFMPNAQLADWDLAIAGQRVQVIKKDDKDGGKLEFGTELICAADGSLAALLGASPGASTAVSVMLEVIKKCFAHHLSDLDWQAKIKEMIPSFGKTLANEPELFQQIFEENNAVLGIQQAAHNQL